MPLLYIKALHVIFMVSWFAGLFFLGRFFIYHKEAIEKNEQSIIDLSISACRRVWYIIVLPSLILTILFGSYLAYKIGAYREGWLHFKLMIVILFVFYNIYLAKLRKAFYQNKPTPKSWKLRLINEVPFFFLVTIIFTVYLKDLFSGLWALFVLIMIVFILSSSLYLFKKKS